MYCEHAWYLKRMGEEAAGEQLAAGENFHARHGQSLMQAAWMRRVALACVVIAMALFVIARLFSV